MPKKSYDFGGWATKFDIRCSDGRTIKHDAFKHQNGLEVPLCWNHSHNEVSNVVGHCVLEHREKGIYAYGVFNNNRVGQEAKELVRNRDVKSLSIYANMLTQTKSGDVIHGEIREVSLVLAGANPGALIDDISGTITHSEDGSDVIEKVIIYCGEDEEGLQNGEELSHSEGEENETVETKTDKSEVDETKELEHANEENKSKEGSEKGPSIMDVYDSFTDEQKVACHALIGLAVQDEREKWEAEKAEATKTEAEDNTAKHSDQEENKNMPNLFDQNQNKTENVLTHSAINDIFVKAKEEGVDSLAKFMKTELEAMSTNEIKHSVTDLDELYPDAKAVGAPETVSREIGWAKEVIGATHKVPFKKIRSRYFNTLGEEARAKGYVTGNEKEEEVILAGKRETTPQTIYKKQGLNRDEILDCEDFDIVNYLKGEMEDMLVEEAARAILVGDGRTALDPDKINASNIRPIWQDNSFYTVNFAVAKSTLTDTAFAKKVISEMRKNKKSYKGSGSPVAYMQQDFLASCLEIEDTNGRYIYADEVALARAMRVSRIVEVPVMDQLVRQDSTTNKYHQCLVVVVNLKDYCIGGGFGKNKGFFSDFDLNFNKQIYLSETRMSGALIKYHAALTFERVTDDNPFPQSV